MKRITIATILVCTFFLFTAASGLAAETATKDECIAKCKQAAGLFASMGVNEALAKINDPKSELVWKDSYVFAIDMQAAQVKAHPITPALIGKMLMGMKDTNGKLFFAEFVNKAKTDGEGWVSYMWPKPGEKTPSSKVTYVYRVPGQNLVMLAGIYE
jgi:cytochrome c